MGVAETVKEKETAQKLGQHQTLGLTLLGSS